MRRVWARVWAIEVERKLKGKYPPLTNAKEDSKRFLKGCTREKIQVLQSRVKIRCYWKRVLVLIP
jgi:hypothetical protein